MPGHNRSVNRWVAGLLLVMLACVPILLNRASGEHLLEDTDTRVLLSRLAERDSPLSWFSGDWPLQNHFYRPVSTLVFELDRFLWGNDPAGYGWTNAVLCALCVLALFWFLKELTDHNFISTSGALVFAFWHTSLGPVVAASGAWLALLPAAAALIPGRRLLPVLSAALLWLFLASEAAGMWPLEFRMIGWLPGRTASVMTLFALLALACYARYERLSARREPAKKSPLYWPPTKGDTPRPAGSKTVLAWAVLSCLFLALALGSYEQAIMLPAALLLVGLTFCAARFRIRWGWHCAFWGMLVAYLALRFQLVPVEVSGYQAQQFRTGPGIWISLFGYLFPSAPALYSLWHSIDLGPIVLLFETGRRALLGFAGNLAAAFWTVRSLPFAAAGWALSCVAFLPMAWLKHFDHYHYWPMAMRALFFAALLPVAGEALVSAMSRPASQAPPRPDPAPGSLPRP